MKNEIFENQPKSVGLFADFQATSEPQQNGQNQKAFLNRRVSVASLGEGTRPLHRFAHPPPAFPCGGLSWAFGPAFNFYLFPFPLFFLFCNSFSLSSFSPLPPLFVFHISFSLLSFPLIPSPLLHHSLSSWHSVRECQILKRTPSPSAQTA